jgi:hypothetical protein
MQKFVGDDGILKSGSLLEEVSAKIKPSCCRTRGPFISHDLDRDPLGFDPDLFRPNPNPLFK